MTESQIIEGCKNNNRKCQRMFVETYSSYMYGICIRYVGQKQEAEDCLQEALIRVLSQMDKYKNIGSFKSWIGKVTAMECLQYLRKNRKHRYADYASIEDHDDDNHTLKRLELNEVLHWIESLPEHYRIAINMFIIEGFSHKEIGENLGITASSSRSLVARARKMINDYFEDTDINNQPFGANQNNILSFIKTKEL